MRDEQRTNIEDRATQPMEARGCVSQLKKREKKRRSIKKKQEEKT